MDGLMRAVAIASGGAGVTINAVAPGWIATGSSTAEELEAGKCTPVGRPGRTRKRLEHGGGLVFWRRRRRSYITGQVLVVDGGNILAGDEEGGKDREKRDWYSPQSAQRSVAQSDHRIWNVSRGVRCWRINSGEKGRLNRACDPDGRLGLCYDARH